jgi:hypothetical protein
MFRNSGFIVRCVEAVDGCETEKRHDQVCLLGKPSTNIVSSRATTEKRWMQLGHSLEPWMQACGYVLWKRKGGIQENPGFWVFAAAPVQPAGSRLFTLKKLCRRHPDLSSLNRSFVMLLPCYKTFSVFYSENVNF